MEAERSYLLELEVKGGTISLTVDSRKLLTVEDDSFSYGMYGCGSITIGRTLFGDFKVEEL